MEGQSSHLQLLPPCDCVILFAAQINVALLLKDTATMMTNARELGNASSAMAKSKFQVAVVLVLQEKTTASNGQEAITLHFVK
jgi:hypothetical protein